MKLKNILLIFTLLIVICVSLGAVSAVDTNNDVDSVNNTDIVTVSNSNLNEVENNEVVTVSNSNLNEVENEDVVAVSDSNLNNENGVSTDNVGTYSDLNDKINSSENYISLDSDYRYNESIDSNFSKGIVINKDNLVLDGNGFTIDGFNLARGFNITGNNVSIKNLKLVNCSISSSISSFGGAIYSNGSLSCFNCSFVNCSSISSFYPRPNHLVSGVVTVSGGGAIYNVGDNFSVGNCSFVNCFTVSSNNGYNYISISSYGGAIYNKGDSFSIGNCSFVNCSSSSSDIYNRYLSDDYDD